MHVRARGKSGEKLVAPAGSESKNLEAGRHFMDVKESYRILELEIGASRAAVDDAYCRLIERWHPDRAATGGPEAAREAQRMVQAINDAYNTLAKIAPNTAQPATLPTPAKSQPPPPAATVIATGKPTLKPLSPSQLAEGRPPPPPPPDAWAARPAPTASATPPPSPLPGDRPGQTPAGQQTGTVPPAPSPAKFLPPPPAAATTPPPPPSTPPTAASAPNPAPSALECPAAQPKATSDFRSTALAIYDKLFPVGSPRRRFGPVILAAALLLLVLLGKCALPSPGSSRAKGPDPKTTGRLVVKSNLADATITATRVTSPSDASTASFDGLIGQPLAGLLPGRYTVTARADGWPDTHKVVSVDAGQTTDAAVNFKSGSLRLDSDPTGAAVRQGAAVLGHTPLVIPMLPVGECQLSLEYPAWPVLSFKTAITENVEATATVRLPYGKVTVNTDPPGVMVLMGGKAVGQTPLSIDRFPAGTRKLTLQAKNFPPLVVPVTVEDHGDVTVSPALGSAFPVLDPAALLRNVWVPDDPDRISPPFDGLSGPSKPQNGVIKYLNRKKLYENWLRRRYGFTAIIKSYDRSNGQIEFAEQQCDLSKYRVLAKLSERARNDPDLAAQLTKGATFSLYGRLSAVEEPRWLSRVITFELSVAEPLR